MDLTLLRQENSSLSGMMVLLHHLMLREETMEGARKKYIDAIFGVDLTEWQVMMDAQCICFCTRDEKMLFLAMRIFQHLFEYDDDCDGGSYLKGYVDYLFQNKEEGEKEEEADLFFEKITDPVFASNEEYFKKLFDSVTFDIHMSDFAELKETQSHFHRILVRSYHYSDLMAEVKHLLTINKEEKREI